MARFEFVECPAESQELVRGWIRPALKAVPSKAAARLGRCRIWLVEGDLDWASKWEAGEDELEFQFALGGEPHDLALEVLWCLGQALWQTVTSSEYETYLRMLDAEIAAGFGGEIDDRAFEAKKRLLSTRAQGRMRRRLREYAEASFAGTFAEYVHAMWHDVTVRTGPEHLPPEWLRKRLELLQAWFPPKRGYRLFA